MISFHQPQIVLFSAHQTCQKKLPSVTKYKSVKKSCTQWQSVQNSCTQWHCSWSNGGGTTGVLPASDSPVSQICPVIFDHTSQIYANIHFSQIFTDFHRFGRSSLITHHKNISQISQIYFTNLPGHLWSHITNICERTFFRQSLWPPQFNLFRNALHLFSSKPSYHLCHT